MACNMVSNEKGISRNANVFLKIVLANKLKFNDNSNTNFEKTHLSEKFKTDLARVRSEVKKGKFTRYNNSQEILDELGL
jgi:hypothetical protein